MNSCAQNYKFTGYERDSETGLDYAMNRYYNSRVGRFMSADPSGIASADLTNPQSLHRYAYVLNNPLIGVDPSGLDCVYDNGDGTANVQPGDCVSPTDSGYYVDASIDLAYPLVLDASTGDLTFATTDGVLVLLGTALLCALSSCGGGGSSGGSGGNAGTPQGSYTLNLNGTAGGVGLTIPLNLTVN